MTAAALLTIASGCSWSLIDKPVYVAPGQYAEVAKETGVWCWITNRETGKRELRKLTAQPGWRVGRAKEGQ